MSDVIFDFIQSMSFREKAYFRRFSQIYSDKPDKNYLRIFDFLDKQKGYDERALKDHFIDEKFVKYLSSEKHYLLEQLLNSQINFHFNTSNYRKLIKLILYVDLLSEKNFRKKAVKILNKAKKLAYKHEDFTIILQLILKEEEILFSHGILHFTKQLRTLKKEREEITQKIQNFNEFRLLKAQARDLQFEELPFITSPEKAPHIYNNPFLQDPANINSLRAQDAALYIKGVSNYLIRNFAEGKKYSQEHLAFVEEYKYLFNDNQKLPIISNYLLFCAKIEAEDDFYSGLKKLENLRGKKDIDSIYIGYIKYARTLELLYKTKNYEQTQLLLPEISTYFKQHHHQLGSTEVDYMLILITRACIITKQFSVAQQWINTWYTFETVDVSLNIIKLFSLITYFELTYWNLIQYEVDSTYKSLKKRKRLYPLERLMLRFFKKVIKDASPHKIKKALLPLEIDLTEIKATPEHNVLFELFDFVEWSRQKLASYSS